MAQAAFASKLVHVPAPPAPIATEHKKEKKARPAPAPISLSTSSSVAMDIDAKKPSRYFLQPILQDGKYYHWPALRVEKIANKGGEHGIRATTVLPANSILVYWGIEISDQRYDRLLALRQKYPVKNATKRYIDYIAVSGRKGFMINANPRFCTHEHVGGYGLWIAGLINEPAPTETSNLVLKKRKIEGRFMPCFITVRDINANEELLADYGPAFERQYAVGKPAPMPWWL